MSTPETPTDAPKPRFMKPSEFFVDAQVFTAITEMQEAAANDMRPIVQTDVIDQSFPATEVCKERPENN